VALITAILGFIVGGAVFFIWGITKQRKDAVNLEAARAQAEEIAKEAQTRSQLVVKEAELKAKDMVVGAKADAEREMRDRRREIAAIEQKLEAREETFEKRQEAFERREADLNRRDQSLRSREKSLTDKEEVLQAHIDEARTKLEAVAGLTREEAKRSLMDEMIGQARTDAAKHIRIVEEEAREEADRRAKRVVAIAIERKPGPLMLAWSSVRYIAFAMHQIVTLPLALYRYGRSVFTGRFEWMKTEHHGVGLPDLSALLAGRPAPAPDVTGPVLARVGFSGGADPTAEAVPPPP